MAVINATSFLLAKEQTVLGHSTSTVLNLEVDLKDATTKDSQGWQEVLAGLRSGRIRSEGLTDYSDSLNFSQLQSMLITRERADFFFKHPNNKFLFRGFGFVTNVSETAEAENAVSFKVELQLSGLYVITDPTEGLTWDIIFTQWESLNTNWQEV